MQLMVKTTFVDWQVARSLRQHQPHRYLWRLRVCDMVCWMTVKHETYPRISVDSSGWQRRRLRMNALRTQRQRSKLLLGLRWRALPGPSMWGPREGYLDKEVRQSMPQALVLLVRVATHDLEMAAAPWHVEMVGGMVRLAGEPSSATPGPPRSLQHLVDSSMALI